LGIGVVIVVRLHFSLSTAVIRYSGYAYLKINVKAKKTLSGFDHIERNEKISTNFLMEHDDLG
jgi:hypothetical protein